MFTDNEDAFAGLQIQMRLAQHDATCRRRDVKIVECGSTGRQSRPRSMRLALRPSLSMVRIDFRKLATRNSVARQSAMLEKLSTNQRSEDCT